MGRDMRKRSRKDEDRYVQSEGDIRYGESEIGVQI